MSAHEASRRYRALKALEQMQKDEEFGNLSDPSMYRLFHEAVSIVKVKEWLDGMIMNTGSPTDKNWKSFTDCLLPQTPEDEEESARAHESKIRTYLDIRNLRDIIGNIEAEESLFDPEKSFNEALAIAVASVALNWNPRIKAASQTLRKMPTSTLKGLSIDEIAPMYELYKQLKETLSDWEKLTGNKIKL